MWRELACGGACQNAQSADSVRNSTSLASERGFDSIAFPLIGAGTGGGSPDEVLMIMRDEISKCAFDGEVRIVRFQR